VKTSLPTCGCISWLAVSSPLVRWLGPSQNRLRGRLGWTLDVCERRRAAQKKVRSSCFSLASLSRPEGTGYHNTKSGKATSCVAVLRGTHGRRGRSYGPGEGGKSKRRHRTITPLSSPRGSRLFPLLFRTRTMVDMIEDALRLHARPFVYGTACPPLCLEACGHCADPEVVACPALSNCRRLCSGLPRNSPLLLSRVHASRFAHASTVRFDGNTSARC